MYIRETWSTRCPVLSRTPADTGPGSEGETHQTECMETQQACALAYDESQRVVYIYRFRLNRSRSLRGAIKRNFCGNRYSIRNVFEQICIGTIFVALYSTDSSANLNRNSFVILSKSYSATHVERKK